MVRTVQCPGSVVLSMLHPETEETPAAAEGTLAHRLAAMAVQEIARGIGLDIDALAADGPWTPDMKNGAVLYAEHVCSVMRDTGVFTPRVEEFVKTAVIHEENGGTPDCWIWDPVNRNLHLWDYKFGFGIKEAFENWQLMNYAALILDQLNVDGLQDQGIRVHLHLVQPRAPHKKGPIRTWTLVASDLRPYVNRMQAAAAEALGPDPTCCTGPECRDCPARAHCDTLRHGSYAAIDMVGGATTTVLEPTAAGAELSILYKAREMLKHLITGREAQIEQAIRGGTVVPGWLFDSKPGRLNWTATPDEIRALGELAGVILDKPDEFITPTQAIAKGVDKDLVANYASRGSNSTKLVEDTGTQAREVFLHGN